ncbi:MAG TPA: hypothetical protein VEB86_08760 [Chryseosolibacter sp.]|nr:hypothetical protein [Chryseosolibacter sp.]
MFKFLVSLVLLTIALALTLRWMHSISLIDAHPSLAYQTLFLLAFATWLIYRYLLRVRKPEQFVQLFLLLTVVKLIAFLGYNFFMVMRDKAGAKYNVLFFLVAYFLYTFFEIAFLYRHVSSKTGR